MVREVKGPARCHSESKHKGGILYRSLAALLILYPLLSEWQKAAGTRLVCIFSESHGKADGTG